jgi:hypothetical protein
MVSKVRKASKKDLPSNGKFQMEIPWSKKLPIILNKVG